MAIDSEGRNDITLSSINDQDEGLFVCTKINKYCSPLLLDTGTSVRILSHNLAKKLEPHIHLQIVPVKLNLVMATGEKRPFLGQCELELKLGTKTIVHEFLVADISQNGIIGLDFMTKHVIDISLKGNYLDIQGEKVQCFIFQN